MFPGVFHEVGADGGVGAKQMQLWFVAIVVREIPQSGCNRGREQTGWFLVHDLFFLANAPDTWLGGRVHSRQTLGHTPRGINSGVAFPQVRRAKRGTERPFSRAEWFGLELAGVVHEVEEKRVRWHDLVQLHGVEDACVPR